MNMHDLWEKVIFYLERITKFLMIKMINSASKAINCDWIPGVRCEVNAGLPVLIEKKALMALNGSSDILQKLLIFLT